MTQTPPKVGVSACLLGHQVRYDGGHKRNAFIIGPLSEHLEFVPVCPETGIGLSVPRPTIRLQGPIDRPRLVGTDDSSWDLTDQMEEYAEMQTGKLGDLCGYILKKDSPSCGMERVKVYNPKGTHAERKGSGIFARVLMQRLPLLPVEEEGRLNDAVLRENFVNRVYVLQRWQQLVQQGLSAAGLIEFHTTHKYLVMAHSQAAYQRMGHLLSNIPSKEINSISESYINELMLALKRRVNRKRHVNVLQHIIGYFKRILSPDEKQELLELIGDFRAGIHDLVVPLTLIRHYIRKHDPSPWLRRQTYFQPYPQF